MQKAVGTKDDGMRTTQTGAARKVMFISPYSEWTFQMRAPDVVSLSGGVRRRDPGFAVQFDNCVTEIDPEKVYDDLSNLGIPGREGVIRGQDIVDAIRQSPFFGNQVFEPKIGEASRENVQDYTQRLLAMSDDQLRREAATQGIVVSSGMGTADMVTAILKALYGAKKTGTKPEEPKSEDN